MCRVVSYLCMIDLTHDTWHAPLVTPRPRPPPHAPSQLSRVLEVDAEAGTVRVQMLEDEEITLPLNDTTVRRLDGTCRDMCSPFSIHNL